MRIKAVTLAAVLALAAASVAACRDGHPGYDSDRHHHHDRDDRHDHEDR